MEGKQRSEQRPGALTLQCRFQMFVPFLCVSVTESGSPAAIPALHGAGGLPVRPAVVAMVCVAQVETIGAGSTSLPSRQSGRSGTLESTLIDHGGAECVCVCVCFLRCALLFSFFHELK